MTRINCVPPETMIDKKKLMEEISNLIDEQLKDNAPQIPDDLVTINKTRIKAVDERDGSIVIGTAYKDGTATYWGFRHEDCRQASSWFADMADYLEATENNT